MSTCLGHGEGQRTRASACDDPKTRNIHRGRCADSCASEDWNALGEPVAWLSRSGRLSDEGALLTLTPLVMARRAVHVFASRRSLANAPPATRTTHLRSAIDPLDGFSQTSTNGSSTGFAWPEPALPAAPSCNGRPDLGLPS